MVLTIRSVHLTNTTYGYRFRTYGKELSLADRKSTNCCVSAIGEGDIKYYGRVEAIYELQFYGENRPNVVVFRCYWFQPRETRRTHEHIGLVEVKQSTHLDVPDVYITAQQATQVFYLPWACQSDPNLSGWASFMKCRHVLDHLPPMKRIMNLTLTKTHMTKENSSKKHVFPKSVSRTALLHPRTLK